MNIAVTITDIQSPDEEYDALLGVVAAAQVTRDAENVRRAAQTPPLDPLTTITPESYLKAGSDSAVASYAQQARANRVKQLEQLTNSLSYEKRTEIAAAVVAIAAEA